MERAAEPSVSALSVWIQSAAAVSFLQFDRSNLIFPLKPQEEILPPYIQSEQID